MKDKDARTPLGIARKEYRTHREEERKLLVEELKKEIAKRVGAESGLHVVYGGRAGKGLPNYTSGRRITEHDLSDWKWVTVKCGDDFECVVSLNMPDVDHHSANWHILFDRVGLLVSYHKDGVYYETAVYPDIDLPLDETDKEQIAQLVLEQYDAYCEKKKKEG